MRKLFRKTLLVLSLALALCVTAAAADTFEATISVDNGTTYGTTVYNTLESAVAAANAATVADTAIRIKFTGSQTFTAPTTVTFDADVRMTAVGEAALSGPLTIDGGGYSRSIHVLQADSAATLTFTGVTVQNIVTTASYGAALRVENSSATLTMTDCTIRNCTGDIGAIYVRKEGIVNLTDCLVEGNAATSSYGGVVHLNSSSSSGTFTGCTFKGNTAPARGSSIYAAGSMSAENCTFTGNSGAAPAAVYVRNSASATLAGCTFMRNSSTAANGAAVYVETGTVTLNGTTMGTAASETNAPYDVTVAGGTLVLKGSLTIGSILDAGGTVALNEEISLASGKKIGVDMKLADAFFAGRKMAENGDKFYIIGMDESETFAIHGRTGRLMTEKQAAVVEMGMAFYEKVTYAQYQQTRISGGSASGYNRFRYQRREPFATLGEISPQKYTWVDCSSFTWALYNNAFSNFYEDGSSLYYPQTGEIMTMAAEAEIGEDKMFVYYRPVTAAERTAAANGDLSAYTQIAAEIKALLQPGDLVDFRRTTGTGHVVMYLGNGYTVESTGSDYDYSAMEDGWDSSGSIKYRGLNSFLLKVNIASSTTGSIFRNNILESVCILRPINGKELEVSDSAKALMQSSGMTATKTALAKGQSAAPGEEITYTITLDNDPSYTDHNGSALARTVTVTDPLSENVSFVSSADGGYVKDGAVVFENLSVGAGKTVSVSYTVKVKEDAAGRIEGTTGNANGILFTCNDIVVGEGMTEAQETALSDKLAAGKTSGTTALAWLNSVYADVLGKNFGVTTDSELFGALFESIGSSYTIDGVKYSPLYKCSFDISETDLLSALVEDMFGGFGVYSQSLSEHRDRVRYVDEAGLKVGDVIATADPSGAYAYYVYRGSDLLKVTDSGTSSAATATVLDSLPAMSRFALLRPSLIRDMNYVARFGSSYYETLEDACAAAAASDGFEEVVLFADLTYESEKTLTLDGETRILIEAGSDITISGPLTITGPGENAVALAFRVNGGKLTLDGVTIKDYHNRGTGHNNSYGGVIRVDTHGTLTLNGVTVENVSAAQRGGFCYITSSTLNVTGSTFKNNYVENDYGGGAIVVYSASTATVTDCDFIGNSAAGSYGGAITVANSSGGSDTKIVGCTFTGNSAEADGAAIRTNGGALSIESCLFEGNVASGAESYATVRMDDSDNAPVVSIKNTQIVNNLSVGTDSSIGIHIAGGETTLEGCTVTGNTRANSTGYSDILVYNGTLTLKGENTVDRVKLNEAMTLGVSGALTGSVGLLGAVEGQTVLSGEAADMAASAGIFDVLDAEGAQAQLYVGTDGAVWAIAPSAQWSVSGDVLGVTLNEGAQQIVCKVVFAAYTADGQMDSAQIAAPESGSASFVRGTLEGKLFFLGENGEPVLNMQDVK